MKKQKSRPNNKRLVAIITSCVIVLIMACASFLALHGARFGPNGLYILKTFSQAITMGLDLRGGVHAVYEVEHPEEGDLDALLADTVSVLRSRLTAQGFTEATVVKQGADRIRVEIPQMQNADDLLSLITTPAVLTFHDADDNLVMEGKHVKSATPYVSDNQYVVQFVFTDEGRALFAEATTNNIGKTIAIKLDGTTIASPTVDTAITEGTCTISGGFTLQTASQLAMLIHFGALPLTIKQLEVSAITATLGAEVLSRAALAGIIGIALVMLFMLVRYRLCGLVADVSLVVYTYAIFFLLAVFPRIQLTLPGIAGIVLGISMAVSANIIIFERIREELKGGRNITYAARLGFKNANATVVDAGMAVLIAALALMIFGTGAIRGFANTLAISAIVSMLSALIVTRLFMKLCINMGILNPKLYSR